MLTEYGGLNDTSRHETYNMKDKNNNMSEVEYSRQSKRKEIEE